MQSFLSIYPTFPSFYFQLGSIVVQDCYYRYCSDWDEVVVAAADVLLLDCELDSFLFSSKKCVLFSLTLTCQDINKTVQFNVDTVGTSMKKFQAKRCIFFILHLSVRPNLLLFYNFSYKNRATYVYYLALGRQFSYFIEHLTLHKKLPRISLMV